VLAVDDEALLLKAYRRMLGDAHELTTALGGTEALRILGRDVAFDVVLCDLQMPEVSGMELFAAVRERFPSLADRFVFVTGGAFSSDARKFLEDSVAVVIQKPFRLDDMLSLIDRTARAASTPAASDLGRPAPRVS
jgi:DNA-binding NtrC family response regulator